MTIGELSARTGLATSAIRFYEQAGLIPRAPRRSGRRVFDERALSQLAVVCLAQDGGFSLAEIRELVTQFGRDRWRRLAIRKRSEVADSIRRLQDVQSLLEKLLECACPDIEFCGRVIRQRGRKRLRESRSAARR